MLSRSSVRVHPFTLPALGLLFAVFARAGIDALSSLLFAIVLHEAGHLLLLGLFSVPLYAVDISARGIRISAELSSVSYAKEAAVSAAGAAVNLLCGALFFVCGMPRAAMPSLLLGMYNLMPLSSFDGGRVLSSLLCAFTPLSLRTIYTICHAVSCVVLILLYLFCGWYFWTLSFGEAADASMLGGAWFAAVWGILTEHLHARGGARPGLSYGKK